MNAPSPRLDLNTRATPLPREDESVGVEAYRAVDRMCEAIKAQFTGGVSPASLALAFFDWSIHLAAAPGKQMELVDKAIRKTARLSTYLVATTA
ncbi:poly-beta-hydroxybutyrate polymerase N-terminal domain-containing protein, partial [Methylosinus sp. R-45379]|uniref:poly-beta-hydroxybutyrate polymerase N-terminal domain-containing protein n=1 Tax=Methylosinus sp. R-45379 TaxID=980563 RepID=UPI000B0A8148